MRHTEDRLRHILYIGGYIMSGHLNARIGCVTEVSMRNCCWVVMISNLAEVYQIPMQGLSRGLRMILVSVRPWWGLCVMGILITSW